MKDELARLVHPIFDHGLRLRERVEAGAPVDLGLEQAALKSLLLTEPEARRWPEFGGDGCRPDDPTAFLGMRYALACWLDELFIRYSPWERAWSERKLETSLYGSSERGWKFWRQVELAERHARLDVLEVHSLCVLLGFRGDLGKTPDKLRAWSEATRDRLAEGRPAAWQAPPELEPPTRVPRLRGAGKVRRMLFACCLTLAALVPAVIYLVVRKLS